jgi:hypothetical protein
MVCLRKVDEDGDGKDRVGTQIAHTNFVVIEKLA